MNTNALGVIKSAPSRYQTYKLRRTEWIKANGPCWVCGSNEHLQVDHVIPRSDIRAVKSAEIWKLSKERRDEELRFCQVLCKKCHAKKTKKDMQWGAHGASKYRHGCRCKFCTESHRLRNLKYRGSKNESP